MAQIIQSIDQNLWQQWQEKQCFPYRLHSRFAHALNFMNEQGEMITFLSQDLPNAPNTLLIDTDSFADWHLPESAELLMHDNDLMLAGKVLPLMSEVQIWAMALPKIHHVNSDVLAKINYFLDSNSDELFDIEKIIYQKLDENFSALLQAMNDQDYETVSESARSCIGLGLGLTPSGDDRLVGFLMGCYGRANRNQQLIDAMKNAIKISTDRTNEISYAMLNTAKEGRFNEWLLELGLAICSDNAEQLDIAISNVFEIGSRSGGDMLKGFALSLEIK